MGVLSNELKTILGHIEKAKDALNKKYKELKKDSIESLKTSEIAARIEEITILDTSDATARHEHILEDKTAYVNGNKIEGCMQDYSGENHSQWLTIVDDSSLAGTDKGFRCRISYDGYVDNKTRFLLPSSEFISWGLTPDIIVKGKEFLDIKGTAETHSDIDISDATATSEDITKDKTAYINGGKTTGSLPDWSGYFTALKVKNIAEENENYGSIMCGILERGIYDESSQLGLSYSKIATAIGLDGSNIIEGTRVLGVAGKIRVFTENNSRCLIKFAGKDGNLVNFKIGHSSFCGYYGEDSILVIDAETLAKAIGLTPDKIKRGERILDVTGTYIG